MKTVRLQTSLVGDDVTTVSIYHTEITGSKLITSSITPEQLNAGLLLNVEDNQNEFLLRVEGGECFNVSSSASITPYSPNTRYFTVNSDGLGTVGSSLPTTIAPTTGSFSTSVNFSIHSFFVIDADSTYPVTFDGWYDKPTGEPGANLLDTGSTLSITKTTFTTTDDFYAYFS